MTIASPVAPSPRLGSNKLTGVVVCSMGLSQLVCWGTLHYLIALFAGPIGDELGWSSAKVQSGFSVATLVMAGMSYPVGRWIDHHGGRTAMMLGCCLGAAGCYLLSVTSTFSWYLGAWVFIGAGMRLALYDAAFATLAHVAGASAKRAISIVTIFGGLASTVFWPVGQHLFEIYGWRGALQWYSAFLLACTAFHLAIPKVGAAETVTPQLAAEVTPRSSRRLELALYTYCAVGVMFLQTGMAAHFLGVLGAAGWEQGTAVWLATLLGIGQFSGRVVIALWAYRVNPVALNLVPALLQFFCFCAYLISGEVMAGAMLFAFLYGAGNGMATYTRGAMPLVLFDPAAYGRIVGLVLKPAFALAATAPIAFGFSLEKWGVHALMFGALGLTTSMSLAAVLLYLRIDVKRR